MAYKVKVGITESATYDVGPQWTEKEYDVLPNNISFDINGLPVYEGAPWKLIYDITKNAIKTVENGDPVGAVNIFIRDMYQIPKMFSTVYAYSETYYDNNKLAEWKGWVEFVDVDMDYTTCNISTSRGFEFNARVRLYPKIKLDLTNNHFLGVLFVWYWTSKTVARSVVTGREYVFYYGTGGSYYWGIGGIEYDTNDYIDYAIKVTKQDAYTHKIEYTMKDTHGGNFSDTGTLKYKEPVLDYKVIRGTVGIYAIISRWYNNRYTHYIVLFPLVLGQI